jgi:hypothetical protein
MKLKLITFMVCTFFFSIAYAQNDREVVEDFIVDGEEDLLLELDDLESDADYSVIDEIGKQDQKRERQRHTYYPSKERKRIAIKPSIFTAILQKGTIIWDVRTGKKYSPQKSVYVKAIEKLPGSQASYIYDKNGKIKFRARTDSLKSVESDIDLLLPFDAIESYENKDQFHTVDEGFALRHFFLIHFETMSSEYYANLYEGDSKAAVGNRFESKNYFTTRLPIQLGINIGHELGTWSDDKVGDVAWNSLFYGPTFLWTALQKDKTSLHFHFGILKSLNHTASTTDSTQTFSSLALQLDTEFQFNTDVGPLLFGLNYRKISTSLKTTTASLNWDIPRGSTHVLSLSLGYLYGWTL